MTRNWRNLPRLGKLCPSVPIAQWIVHLPSKQGMEVRFLLGTLPFSVREEAWRDPAPDWEAPKPSSLALAFSLPPSPKQAPVYSTGSLPRHLSCPVPCLLVGRGGV